MTTTKRGQLARPQRSGAEEQWLVGCNPERMLAAFGAPSSPRKVRLLVCAWVRTLDELLTRRGRAALDTAERHADGAVSADELAEARRGVTQGSRRSPARAAAAWAVFFAAGDLRGGPGDCLHSVRQAAEQLGRLGETDLLLCGHLRDVTGNPFRPHASIASAIGKDDRIATLARAAYEARLWPTATLDPARLLELADALTEAGCTDADLLEHCRRSGAHVRGCWLLDLLMGES